MAIKVKHEGNVTSRIVGSASGANGRRGFEEGIKLASLAAQQDQAAMALGAQLRPQMVQAHAQAPGSPSLIHAPTGGGGQVQAHASFGPAPHRPYSSGGGGSRPKNGKKGGGEVMPGNLVQTRDGKNPEWELQDDNGNTIRSYSRGQIDNILRRGDAGATMGRQDATTYWRYRGGKTARELATEDADKERAFRAGEAEKQRRFDLLKPIHEEKIRRGGAIFDKNLREGEDARKRWKDLDALTSDIGNAVTAATSVLSGTNGEVSSTGSNAVAALAKGLAEQSDPALSSPAPVGDNLEAVATRTAVTQAASPWGSMPSGYSSRSSSFLRPTGTLADMPPSDFSAVRGYGDAYEGLFGALLSGNQGIDYIV